MYVKMKELSPVGGGHAPGTPPLDPPMICIFKDEIPLKPTSQCAGHLNCRMVEGEQFASTDILEFTLNQMLKLYTLVI